MLTLISLLACLNTIYAQASQISCSAQVDGENINISGQIPNAQESNFVSLLVGEPENIVYIDQTVSDKNGNFNFSFMLPDTLPRGTYKYKIGSNSGLPPYEGTLNYNSSFVLVKNQFFDADVNITISNYVPTVSGTISCIESKTIIVNIINKTDNITIDSDTITSEDGIYNFAYTLPSLLVPKEYEVVVSCSENDVNVTYMNVTIDSSILFLNLGGTVTTSDNVDVEAHLQSVNTGLIDKETSFSGSKTVSVSIPNLLPSCSFHLSAKGYETVLTKIEEEYSICSLNLNGGNERLVMAIGKNISSFEGKLFKLTYDSEKVIPIKLSGIYPESVLGTGQFDNIEILSHELGEIVFKVINAEIPSERYLSGVINIFKFKNLSDESINTDIKFEAL